MIDALPRIFELVSTPVWIGFILVLASTLMVGSLRWGALSVAGVGLWPFITLISVCSRFSRLSPEYLTGYRFAYLSCYLGGDDDKQFHALRFGHPSFGVDSKAICAHHRGHVAPDSSCECGFYSLKHKWMLGLIQGSVPQGEGPNAALVRLQVDLSGHVIEGGLGYRAERQRILRVELFPRCGYCHLNGRRYRPRRATGLGRYNRYLVATCKRCHPHQTPLSELADRLGTEVTWMNSRPS